MLLSKLRNFDYFSFKPRIYFKRKESYPTWLGLIVSVAIFVSIILALNKFSQNLLYKTKPIILNTKKYFLEVPQHDLNNDGWFMSFFFNRGITDFVMDPSIFSVECELRQITATPNGTIDIIYLPIELEPCSKEHIPPETDELAMNRLNYKKNYCFKKNSTAKAILQGFWGMEKFNMLYVRFRKCRNSTSSSIVCQSEESINNLIKEGYFGANVLDNFLDLEDFERFKFK